MTTKKLYLLIGLLVMTVASFAQPGNSVKFSDLTVQYDTISSRVIGTIPFDRRFTLKIPVRKGTQVKKVRVYCAEFHNGQRILTSNTTTNVILPDLILDAAVSFDSLTIPFPPIKPNKNFEVIVTKPLSGALLKMNYLLNQDLFHGRTADANLHLTQLSAMSQESLTSVRFFNYLTLPRYRTFFSAQLAGFYTSLHSPAAMYYPSYFSFADINYLENNLYGLDIPFNDLNRIVRVLQDGFTAGISDGTRTIKYDNLTDADDAEDYAARISNLKASTTYFDTLTNSLAACLAARNDTRMRAVWTVADQINQALKHNLQTLSTAFDGINAALTANPQISQAEVLIGSTVAKDIKTSSGNFITLDMGVVGIWTKDSKHQTIWQAKPYYGLNFYFRAIDKNTRHQDFPDHTPRNKLSGPMNKLATENCFWQHFSATIGLTFGGLSNGDFDYLINKSVLLVGCGYRMDFIRRTFKLNTGLSLMKRSSYNPLISDKKVVGGYYISASFDVDILQGVNDFIKLIFQ